ncbi:uncharacterized protein [Narcine bancroftii]|uniref:uncharacterized protein isoform X3 n=1 Tax=Narcine bancroftii TaxID=1343680 RepID=UPI003831E700
MCDLHRTVHRTQCERKSSPQTMSADGLGLKKIGNMVEAGLENESVEFQREMFSAIDSLESTSPSMSALGNIHVLNFNPVLMSNFAFPKSWMEVLGVTYNSKSRRLILLDSLGCVSWSLTPASGGKREVEFPKHILKQIIHCNKFNVYFALGKDYSLKVYNRDFCETFTVPNFDLKVVTSIVFNPKTDELITGGVGGVKFWKYKVNPKSMNRIIAMSNYELFLRADSHHVEGTWVNKVELDVGTQLVFCCSVQALLCYDMDGKLMLQIPYPHKSSPTGCIYSPHDRTLLTCSGDCHINRWTRNGTFLHRFTGHTRAITNLLLHPQTTSIFISSSKDGTIKFWSLDTLSQLLSLPMFEEGIEWMGLTETNLLYCCSLRHCCTYSLDYFTHFWSYTSSSVAHIGIASAKGKTTRVTVLQQEGSLNIMSQCQGKNLSVVLPLPLKSLMQYTYNRAKNLVFYLVDPAEIWIYSVRTNPACRVAVWNVQEIIKNKEPLNGGRWSGQISVAEDTGSSPFDRGLWKVPVHVCCCIASLSSCIYFATSEGVSCANSKEFLLLGMEDGWMFFMDTEIDDLLYHQMQAHRGPVILMKQNVYQDQFLSVGQETTGKCLRIWSLPRLDLLHKVPIPQGTVSLAIMGTHVCLGLESGSIVFRDVKVTDLGLLPPSSSQRPDLDKWCEFEEDQRFLMGNVFTDACPEKNIFLSCSGEELMKIWDPKGNLLTEVVLDHAPTHAIFLDNKGNVLMGFKDHLFLIPHQKLMLEGMDATSDISAEESDIYEDPAIKYEYEGISQHETDAHLDIDSYLDRDDNQAVTTATSACSAILKKPENISQRPDILEAEIEKGALESKQLIPCPEDAPCVASPSGGEAEDGVQENTLELLDLELSELRLLSRSSSFLEVSGEWTTSSDTKLPTEEDVETQSTDNVHKELHHCPGYTTINGLQSPIELNLTDTFPWAGPSNASADTGQKLDGAFSANKQWMHHNRGLKYTLNLGQSFFLNIYEDKLIQKRKLARKLKKVPKGRIKIPQYFQVTKRKVANANEQRTPHNGQSSKKVTSSGNSDNEVNQNLRRVKISVMDWLWSNQQRREAQMQIQQERASMSQDRRIVHQLQRIIRQRSLPGHENCIKPQAVKQVIGSKVQVVQSQPPPLQSRLTGKIPISSSLLIPPLFPAPPAARKPSPPTLPLDPRYQAFVLVRETYAPSEMPPPTPLEMKLLKERFPNFKLPLVKHRPRLIDRKIYSIDNHDSSVLEKNLPKLYNGCTAWRQHSSVRQRTK